MTKAELMKIGAMMMGMDYHEPNYRKALERGDE